MKIERRVHVVQENLTESPTVDGLWATRIEAVTERTYVRWHVVDNEGRCIPDICVGTTGQCGYQRKYQAIQAAARARKELSEIAQFIEASR